MVKGKKITLVVSGSIAVYKAAELVRDLVKGGAEVRVVMTGGAEKFVTPLTFQTLSGNAVRTEMFSQQEESEINHIELADKADVVVVAPATANIIAKARAGIADDLASAVLLATTKPLLFAPAMNVNMWESRATRENVAVLMDRGAAFVGPVEGELACGWKGIGKFAETEDIKSRIAAICAEQDMRGIRVIVAAGPTREWIDPVRFISNSSSGKMGYAVARAARNRGASVTLVSGPTYLEPPDSIGFHVVENAASMHKKVISLTKEHTPAAITIVFMVAAVADHRPKDISKSKVKTNKNQAYALEMTPNPDILHQLGAEKKEIAKESNSVLRLVGFAAETGDEEDLLLWARQKLEQKNADLIVGNFVEDSFGKDTNRVWLLDTTGRQEEVSTTDKGLIAERVISAALRMC